MKKGKKYIVVFTNFGIEFLFWFSFLSSLCAEEICLCSRLKTNKCDVAVVSKYMIHDFLANNLFINLLTESTFISIVPYLKDIPILLLVRGIPSRNLL